MFSVIAAVDSNNGIGKDGGIPWHCPADMQHFRKTTLNHIVIMGKHTYSRIKHGLPNRITCVISRTIAQPISDSVKVFRDPWDCVRWCQANRNASHAVNEGEPTKYKRKLYVCGGAQIYDWFYKNGLVGEEIITNIVGEYNCSVNITFPAVRRVVTSTKIIRGPRQNVTVLPECAKNCDHCTRVMLIYYYRFINEEEMQGLNLMRDILKSGDKRKDRTGTGALSVFGRQLRFSLLNNKLPMMTTRPLFLRGLFEELMLFLRGQTDSKILERKRVNIWKGNTSREFLDSRGLQRYAVGDMGHTYGFRFRHFGAKYDGCDKDYTGQGCDQLMNLIHGIKNNPHSRRHIISLWEPNHADDASLPPCVYQYQFYVSDGMLSCMITQRSSDIVTALNWNICSGALLTYLIAFYCGLKPRELIWNGGDIHIYNNLISAATTQITRTPRIFPTLFLRDMPVNITLVEFNNLEIINYHPLPKGDITIVMNV